MKNAAKSLFDSIKSYSDLDKLIIEGESESIFLECKAPEQPVLNMDLQMTLGKAISGFSNTNGGIIIWGISTTKKTKSGLDILTQIEPIGQCKRFSSEIANKIPTLSIPSVFKFENKIIIKKKNDTRGVVITYIPPATSDPVQSLKDQHFYYRSGDKFTVTPYQMLKRLFASSESPDLEAFIPNDNVKKEADGFWDIPIAIRNLSSAVGENVKMNIEIMNPDVCLEIHPKNIRDISSLNPGRKLYSAEMDGVSHRGFDTILAELRIKMKENKKKIILKINLFANKMRANSQIFNMSLHKNKYTARKVKEEYLY